MPQPHEQKLQEVENSLISASLRDSVAAWSAGQSRRPPTASPAPPPTVILSRSRRLTPRVTGGALMKAPVLRVDPGLQVVSRARRQRKQRIALQFSGDPELPPAYRRLTDWQHPCLHRHAAGASSRPIPQNRGF